MKIKILITYSNQVITMYDSSNNTTSKDATINVNDIYQYNNTTLLVDFVVCQNLIHMKGIKYLYDDLPQQKLDNVVQLRQRYTHALLDDIAVISKLLDTTSNTPGTPISIVGLEFKENFYDEALKTPQDRSKEYNEFIKRWAQQSDTLPLPYKLSAKVLLALDKENIDSTQLQEQLIEILNHDKQVSTEQCDKDFDRVVIGYRGKDKVARQISVAELKNSPDLNLTNEQRDFIASYWHQGTFSSATYMYLRNYLNNLRQKIDNDHKLQNTDLVYNKDQEVRIFIDAQDGSTKIYNAVDTSLCNPVNVEIANIPWASTSMSVDISNMTGNRFMPSCSELPNITVYMHQLYNDHNIRVFDISQSLNISVAPVESKVHEVKNLFTQACIHSVASIKQNADGFDHEQSKAWASLEKMHGLSSALEMVIKHLYAKDQGQSSKVEEIHNIIKKILIIDTAPTSDDAKREAYNSRVHILKESMAYFCKEEKNTNLRNEFTGKILHLVDLLHNNHEDIVNIKDIKKNVTTILLPLCTNNREAKALEKGISKLIGPNIDSTGKLKKWKVLKAQILNILDHVFGRNRVYENITKKYPEIQQIHDNLSKHLKINMEKQNKPITPNNKKTKNSLSKFY